MVRLLEIALTSALTWISALILAAPLFEGKAIKLYLESTYPEYPWMYSFILLLHIVIGISINGYAWLGVPKLFKEDSDEE